MMSLRPCVIVVLKIRNLNHSLVKLKKVFYRKQFQSEFQPWEEKVVTWARLMRAVVED